MNAQLEAVHEFMDHNLPGSISTSVIVWDLVPMLTHPYRCCCLVTPVEKTERQVSPEIRAMVKPSLDADVQTVTRSSPCYQLVRLHSELTIGFYHCSSSALYCCQYHQQQYGDVSIAVLAEKLSCITPRLDKYCSTNSKCKA